MAWPQKQNAAPVWMAELLAQSVARHFKPSACTCGLPAWPCMTLKRIGMMPAFTKASLQPSCLASSLILGTGNSPDDKSPGAC